MTGIINKTMDRSDLLTDEAKPIVEALSNLVDKLYSHGLFMTSWYGDLPDGPGVSKDKIKRFVKRILGRKIDDRLQVGVENRGPDYQPIPGCADDGRIPWYWYWKIFWIMTRGPRLRPGMRLLDAGGASSLFSCYLASLGYEVHSIEINKPLVSNAKRIAKVFGWNMFSYGMNMKKLDFEDEIFDHAYSIGVFQSLDYEDKQNTLLEIARCLKPNGVLSVTFDYRNPAPPQYPYGFDTSERNSLKTEDDMRRAFLSLRCWELVGNQKFFDNGKSYLLHPMYSNAPYTFGIIFLRKKS